MTKSEGPWFRISPLVHYKPILWHLALHCILSYQPLDCTNCPGGILGHTSPAMSSKTLVHKRALGMTAHFQHSKLMQSKSWLWFDASQPQQGKFTGGKDQKTKSYSKDFFYLLFLFFSFTCMIFPGMHSKSILLLYNRLLWNLHLS